MAALSAAGQTKLESIMDCINNMDKQLPVEKIYLQTDKPNYVQGDTIWFKGYLLDAGYLTPSAHSGLLYVELDNAQDSCVKRLMLPLITGLTWGNIILNEDDIPEGDYIIRAYTNWMQNFGTDFIYNKNIYIASSGTKAQLVVAGFKADKSNIQTSILLTDLSRQPVRLADLQLRVMDGRHTLYRKRTATGVDGSFDLNFTVPEKVKAKNLSIIVMEKNGREKPVSLTIPVTLNRPENTDLQFMPEGGALVAGVQSKIGFKAIGEDGKGIQVSGRIYDSKQQEVVAFNSAHLGIGSFEITPQPGEIYTAKLVFANGLSKAYPLPLVNTEGTVLKIIKFSKDSLRIKVGANTALPADYYLIGQSRGTVCYGAHLVFKKRELLITLSQNIFPTGIAHFTLFNKNNQPLNERLVYINHHDNLKIDITQDQQKYNPHDSIALQLQVTDNDGRPVAGNFSMAVTDDNQVKTDTVGDNIINNLLFSKDLKGYIEEPGYYFADRSPERETELDNLLLTQGWIGCNWKQIFNPPQQPAFEAQKDFEVTGIVTNAFNKPVDKANVVLLSKKPLVIKDTITGKDGRFKFTGLFPIDTATYIVQTRRKSGSSFNVSLNVDELKVPLFNPPVFRTTPWYVNSDTLLLHNRDSKMSQHLAQEEAEGRGMMLKEVVIKDKRIIKNSKNLNGPGEADYTLDEKDMEKYPKLDLYDLLNKKFPGINETMNVGVITYRLKNHIVNFFIDGVEINRLGLDAGMYMHYLTSEDILGIEVMYNSRFAMRYDPNFMSKLMGQDRDVPVFLEITTRSGNGAFMKKIPGIYIYKPLAYSLPKDFYRPRYTVKTIPKGTDQRSTIHWEPNIVTGADGKAIVSFYSADKPSTYTITVQGTDLNGQLGYIRNKIVIVTPSFNPSPK
ncbi:carboxypeptidase-like regulatory domain-containing protein [Mucilaginibacter oryzae]|nr:carboxypeptidase-like regulatory domain-containing protein [Mucilaginibacter oryzae]